MGEHWTTTCLKGFRVGVWLCGGVYDTFRNMAAPSFDWLAASIDSFLLFLFFFQLARAPSACSAVGRGGARRAPESAVS